MRQWRSSGAGPPRQSRAARLLSRIGMVLSVLAAPSAAIAQSSGCGRLAGGAQSVSAVVWRGLEFATAPSLQPWFEVACGPASVEATTSWAVDGSWVDHEAVANLSAPSPFGTAALRVAMHAFPSAAAEMTSPVTEIGVGYTTPGTIPISILATRNVAHDPEGAAQAEANIRGEWSVMSAELFGNIALNRSDYYEAAPGDVLQSGFALIAHRRAANGLTLSLSAAAVYSPVHSRGWFVVGAAIELSGGSRVEEEQVAVGFAAPASTRTRRTQ